MLIKEASVTVQIPATEVVAALRAGLEQKFAALGKLTGADTADGDLTVTLTFKQSEASQ